MLVITFSNILSPALMIPIKIPSGPDAFQLEKLYIDCLAIFSVN